MIRLGLIGNGAWGKNYIRTIGALPDCELPSDAVKTRNYKELLLRKDIDGIVIATPASTHLRVATDCINAGYPVLIEKPLATREKDAKTLESLAKRRKVPAMVGHIFIYHKGVQALKVAMKQVGKVQLIYSESMDQGPVRKDTTALWDWGPHDVSIAVHLLGRQPQFVSGWDLGYGMVSVRLSFAHGVEFVSLMGWSARAKKRSIQITGRKKSLFFDDVTYKHAAGDMPLTLEVKEFVRCIKSGKSPRTPLSDGVVVTKILAAAQKSMGQHGKRVKI